MSMSVYPKITGDLDPPVRIALAHLSVSSYKIEYYVCLILIFCFIFTAMQNYNDDSPD